MAPDDVEDVGRAHAHLAPLEAVGDRRGEALALRIVDEGAERALAVIVVVALEFEIADDRLGLSSLQSDSSTT